ncbi:MAG: hypothetical protein IPI81_09400 [Flavobacteriales bacterium]|nr:hypothetical protein [Flavobacteriales bacterium]MCC6939244.1 hypothetical protein [Flavobacteriales bacterium]
MTSFHEEQLKARQAQLHSVPAKRLLERLKDIPSQVDLLQRRWFWELLQNAWDARKVGGQVDLVLEVGADRIVLMHDGRPFGRTEVENLIKPDSDKDDKELASTNIGKYGTGFVSTHVLSAVIKVQGLIEDHAGERVEHQSFNFQLDRTAYDDKEALKESITASETELDSSMVPASPTRFDTQFTYDLSRPIAGLESHSIAMVGLESIESVLPCTFVSLPEVRSVVVLDRRDGSNERTVEYAASFPSAHEVRVTKVVDGHDGRSESVQEFFFVEHGMARVIVRIENGCVVPVAHDLPRLFKFLPMVGTEDFCFPVTIHSAHFVPRTERDGIELSGADLNRSILIDALSAFKDLLSQLSQKGIGHLHNIAHWPDWKPRTEEAKTWLTEKVIEPLNKILLDSEIVETGNGIVKLREVSVPSIAHDDEQKEVFLAYHDLLSDGPRLVLPQRDVSHAWYEGSRMAWGASVTFPLRKLCLAASQFGTIDKAQEMVQDAMTWLNRLVAFALEHESNLLDEFALIPDGTGRFRKRKEDLYWNGGLPLDLLTIHDELTQRPFLSHVIHSDIQAREDLCDLEKRKGKGDLAAAINDTFRELHEQKFSAQQIKALRDLFKWSEGKGYDDVKKQLDWFHRHRSDLFMKTFSENQKDLAFAIVQSGKMEVLSSIANSSISADDLQFISDHPSKLAAIVKWIKAIEDDETHADSDIGERGESIVHTKLKERFPEPVYEIVWSSKEGEQRYDFEVRLRQDKVTVLYVDAKTTNSGFANTDSIPFFLRKSQWVFLEDPLARQKYEVARVFLENEESSIRWLRLSIGD